MLLQAMAESHVPTITEACNDWEELSSYGPPYWRPRSTAELLRKIAAMSGPTVASEYNFVIDTGEALVGECSLHTIDWRNRVAQVGICLWQPVTRGQGIGRAAAGQLISWADNQLGLLRLEAWVLASNTPSLRLFTSLGFVHEGTLRGRYLQQGQRRDMQVLGRLSSPTEHVRLPVPSPASMATTEGRAR